MPTRKQQNRALATALRNQGFQPSNPTVWTAAKTGTLTGFTPPTDWPTGAPVSQARNRRSTDWWTCNTRVTA